MNVYVVRYAGTEQIATLSDNYLYEYNEETDTFSKVLQEIDIEERDTNVHELKEVKRKGIYEEASLLFLFDSICPYSQKKLSFIIRHEFVHLKDALETQRSQDDLNAIRLQSLAAESLKKKATLNSARLFSYLQDAFNYISKSELAAYVPIVMEELSSVRSKELLELLNKNDSSIISFMNRHSSAFNNIYSIQQNLFASKSNFSTADKVNFAELFIKRIFGRNDNYSKLISKITRTTLLVRLINSSMH